MAMAVKYVPIDNESVSVQWWVLLRDLRREGVWFNVNEGHRTMARQRYFWQGSPSNPNRTWSGNLAAYPSDNAPHIRTGRFDHAIDFNNAAGVIQAARRRGVYLYLSVRGESWHVEADRGDLQRYYERHRGPVEDAVGYAPVIRRGSHGPAVYRLQTYLKHKGYWPYRRQSKAFGAFTDEQVRAFQRARHMKADGIVGPKTWAALRRRTT